MPSPVLQAAMLQELQALTGWFLLGENAAFSSVSAAEIQAISHTCDMHVAQQEEGGRLGEVAVISISN